EANYEEFLENTMLIDSVNMNLMIIGEATKNLSTELQNQYTDVDWRNIAGLRNIITHEYFRLNLKLIWDVIENELPKLKEQVKEILEDIDNG
ncbi:MAG: HepT-like ribonuclease domain-containing protein, partial [Chloroflexota bacterium]